MKSDLLLKFIVTCLAATTATSAFVTPTFSPRSSSRVPSAFRSRDRRVHSAPQTRTCGRCPSVGGPLYAKKKKKAVGGKAGKVQVKLLKHVDGTGKVGDVIMVAPAFFENKLKRSQSAVLITDEEVAKEREEQAQNQKETLDAATEMKSKIEDLTLTFPMKAGPNGHLFGGVNNKAILTQLKKQFPKGAIGKSVKVETVKDGEGKNVAHDIKEIGDFKATISLLKDVSADLSISVVEQT